MLNNSEIKRSLNIHHAKNSVGISSRRNFIYIFLSDVIFTYSGHMCRRKSFFCSLCILDILIDALGSGLACTHSEDGSPRSKGNTSTLVSIFRQEAEKLGHTVNTVQVGRLNIHGCKNCNACRNTLNGDCVQKDDMQAVLPLMRECEVLILATPIYYYSMVGQLHCAIERMYSFERLPKLRKSALIMTAAAGGFSSATQTYRDAILGHMGAQNLGIITAIGNQSISIDKQNEMRKLAQRI